MGLLHIKSVCDSNYCVRFDEFKGKVYVLIDDICKNLLIESPETVLKYIDCDELFTKDSLIFVSEFGLMQIYANIHRIIPEEFDVFLKVRVFKPVKWMNYNLYKFCSKNLQILNIARFISGNRENDIYLKLDDLVGLLGGVSREYLFSLNSNIHKEIQVFRWNNDIVARGIPISTAIWFTNVLPQSASVESLNNWLTNIIIPELEVNIDETNHLSQKLKNIFDLDSKVAYSLSNNKKFVKFFSNIENIFKVDN